MNTTETQSGSSLQRSVRADELLASDWPMKYASAANGMDEGYDGSCPCGLIHGEGFEVEVHCWRSGCQRGCQYSGIHVSGTLDETTLRKIGEHIRENNGWTNHTDWNVTASPNSVISLKHPIRRNMSTNTRKLIGLALFDADVAVMAAGEYGVTPDHFRAGTEREIWSAILALHAARQSTEPYFVHVRLLQDGVGVAEEHIRAYEADAPRGRNAGDSACLGVIEDYIRERGAAIGATLSDSATDPRGVVAQAAHDLTSLASIGGRVENMDDVAGRVEKEWEDTFAGLAKGLPMPWPSVWRMSGGTHPGGVCLMVGHGGVGKSAAALQWAAFAAQHGFPSLVLPMEDGVDEAYRRLSYMSSDKDAFRVSVGRCRREDLDSVKTAGRAWRDTPLYLHGGAGVDYRTLPAVVQKYVAKHGVRAVFVDAFKDLGSDGSVEIDNLIMSSLAGMARRWNLYFIVNHHVRKTPPATAGGEAWYIRKDDLRGSGRIWDDARMVMILQQRPSKCEDGGDPFDFRLQVAKNNKGRSGFDMPVTRKPSLAWVEIPKPDDEKNVDNGREKV